MLLKFLDAMSKINPVSTFEFWGKQVDQANKNWKKSLAVLPLSSEQRDFWEILGNFNVADWYFKENSLKNYEALLNFRKKIIINMIREFFKKNLDIPKVAKLIQVGLDRETEIFKKDDKNIQQISANFREKFWEALFSKNEKAWLEFSREYFDQQYWAGRGQKKLMETVRSEYGLDVSTEEVFRTPCLRLLKVIPVYAKGEKPEDFPYTKQPVMWLPPTVLDHHIVSLLPNYGMSLVHYLAKFHPVYVVILNDYTSPDVLKMTKEIFVDQIAELLKFINEQEKTRAIFAGYCQGGTLAILSSLTEKIRPYIKAVFTAAAASGKKEDDSEITSLFLDSLDMVSEVAKKGYMVAPEFLSIGLKKEGWSPFGDLLNNLIKAEKYTERIKRLMNENDYDIKKAKKVLAYEIIKEVVLEIWLSSMRAIPMATTEMTLPVFRDGIMPDGSYNLELFGKKLNVKDFEKWGIPVYIFAGEFDKVVPQESSTEIAKFIKNCFIKLFKGGHVALANNLRNGLFQTPIVKAVEKVSKMK